MIPVGKPLERGRGIREIAIKLKLSNLRLRSFTGYLCVTTKEESIQDGMLIIEKGKVIGAVYEYLKFGKIFFGKNALILTMNASIAKKGVVDIFELTESSLGSLKNEFKEGLLKEPIELSDAQISHLLPTEFRSDYEEKVKNLIKAENRDAILSRYGIRELAREGDREITEKLIEA